MSAALELGVLLLGGVSTAVAAIAAIVMGKKVPQRGHEITIVKDGARLTISGSDPHQVAQQVEQLLK